MKQWLAALAIALPAITAAGCGGQAAHRPSRTAPATASQGASAARESTNGTGTARTAAHGARPTATATHAAGAASNASDAPPGVEPGKPQRSLPGRRTFNDLDTDDYAASESDDADNDDTKGPVDLDGDTDRGGAHGYYDSDDTQASTLGQPAAPADSRAVTALVKRYFAAAVAADGARACAMFSPGIARATPAIFGRPPTPYARGSTCAQVMHGMFRFRSYLMAAEARHLRVAEVRVKDSEGVALLSVRSGRLQQLRLLPVVRERGIWKIRWAVDTELP